MVNVLLIRIVFLVDIRHKPTANDRLMYNYIISSKIPFIIFFDKEAGWRVSILVTSK